MTILIGVCWCASILLSGCATAKKPLVNEKNPSDTQIGTPQQTNDAEKRVMANRLSNLAMSVSGVNKATVVVAEGKTDAAGKTTPTPTDGNMANPNAMSDKLVVMAGLQLDPKVAQDKGAETNIINEVKAKIKADSPKVSEVLVTTSPELIKKLQDVAAGVIQGKPVQSYAQDIDELNKNIRGQ
jgi:hypothetical protein